MDRPFCEIDPDRMPYRFEAQSIFLERIKKSEKSDLCADDKKRNCDLPNC